MNPGKPGARGPALDGITASAVILDGQLHGTCRPVGRLSEQLERQFDIARSGVLRGIGQTLLRNTEDVDRRRVGQLPKAAACR